MMKKSLFLTLALLLSACRYETSPQGIIACGYEHNIVVNGVKPEICRTTGLPNEFIEFLR